MRGSVASWIISGRPPETVAAGTGVWAVWIPSRASAFVVGPAPKSNGPLSAQDLSRQVDAARQRGIPDVIIGDHRVFAVGDAWQRSHLIDALQQLLSQGTLDQLALVDRRVPWHHRLWSWMVGAMNT